MSNRSSDAVCTRIGRGHNVHWIQFRLTWAEPEHDPIPATLVEVRDDGELTLEVDGALRHYWNHAPDALDFIARTFDGDFVLVGYGVLTVPQRRRRYGKGFPAFTLTQVAPGDRKPCFPGDPTPRGGMQRWISCVDDD